MVFLFVSQKKWRRNSTSEFPVKAKLLRIHKKKASFFSRLTFWWMNEVFKTGAKRPLEESDLLPLQKEHETEALTDTLWDKWTQELKRSEETRSDPQLWRCAFRAMPTREFFVIMVSDFLDCAPNLLEQLLLGIIVSTIGALQENERSFLWLYASLMFFASIVRILAAHAFFYRSFVLGMQLQVALKGMVYKKVKKRFEKCSACELKIVFISGLYVT